jgi:hypothetical protein
MKSIVFRFPVSPVNDSVGYLELVQDEFKKLDKSSIVEFDDGAENATLLVAINPDELFRSDAGFHR